jgi:hypothetical protein
MTVTELNAEVETHLRQARETFSIYEENAPLKQTSKAIEAGGEILVEALNALYTLWNFSMTDAEQDDMELLMKGVADAGLRLRESAIQHGLVAERGGSHVLDPGPEIRKADSAIFHMRRLLGEEGL